MPRENPTGEKTEDPTPRRKEEAREEGQVAKSQELSSAFTLMGSFLILAVFFNRMFADLQHKMIELLTLEGPPLVDVRNSFTLVMDSFYFIAGLVAPVMLASAVVGAVINFIQVGPLFTVKAIKPRFSNVNPVSGVKNIFSLKSVVELMKSLLKAIIITILAYLQIRKSWSMLVTIPRQGLKPALVLIGEIIFRIGINIIIFLIILGIADYCYRRWDHKKNLMMTKREVKEERKEREGDPQIKQKRKEQQRQMSLNRMMRSMEEADVVVTNPVHVAVALKYDLESMEAPVVVAKGKRYIAERIKEKARELGIEIVENKSLARALNETTEIGDEIPVDLYQAVAEVLAFVYESDRNRRG